MAFLWPVGGGLVKWDHAEKWGEIVNIVLYKQLRLL